VLWGVAREEVVEVQLDQVTDVFAGLTGLVLQQKKPLDGRAQEMVQVTETPIFPKVNTRTQHVTIEAFAETIIFDGHVA
jgi:hypothetical protein